MDFTISRKLVIPLLVTVALAAIFISVFSGCTNLQSEQSAEAIDKQAVARQQKQYVLGQPTPAFDWSLERDVAIQLYQARNDRVQTWTVWRSNYGMVEGHCESIGYPLPYDVQLTNPLKSEYRKVHQSITGITLEQAEPNGLYSSHNSIATWVRAVVNGKEVPIYIEGKVTCYPYPIDVDYETNRVTRAEGEPTVVIEKRAK